MATMRRKTPLVRVHREDNVSGSGSNVTRARRTLPSSTTAPAAATLLLTSPAPFVVLGLMLVGWSAFLLQQGHHHVLHHAPETSIEIQEQQVVALPFMKHREWIEQDLQTDYGTTDDVDWSLPMGLEAVLDRASENKEECIDMMEQEQQGGNEMDANEIDAAFDQRFDIPFGTSNNNDTVATLPSFGIIQQLEAFRYDPEAAIAALPPNEYLTTTTLQPQDWQCDIPPETECDETQLTVIFMAYHPDRLGKALRQIRTMLTADDWTTLVAQVVVVWNGPRHVNESDDGRQLLQFAETTSNNNNTLRIVYPLQMGLENDLLNRYHPQVVQVDRTKAILYYDDDGPFYSFAAVQGGFELWKRHSDAQVGAMAREITYGPRQRQEHAALLGDAAVADDRQFVSHCTNLHDRVDYNYRYFANYDANMVLPSGSLLHVNYLCFLWHPALEPIRRFVRRHPVHPDDVTVSTVVSHLAGRAPRTYSRRLNPPQDKDGSGGTNENNAPQQRLRRGSKPRQRRRLSESNVTDTTATIETWMDWESGMDDDDDDGSDDPTLGWIPASEYERHRRLMFGIDWDAKGGMDQNKQYWADLRTEAINSMVQYFGSINSGSIGWCDGLPEYYNPKKDGRCDPVMAKIGWLPWMNPDGSPKDTCP